MRVEKNRLLKNLTTFRIGGPAKFFAAAKTEKDVVSAITFAEKKGIPFHILGGGSNILVSDSGFPGLVILVSIPGIQEIDENGKITVGAGEQWDDFVRFCVEKNFAGVECLSGIPGTVGAAPVQNINAYGQSVGDVIDSVYAIDTKTRKRILFSKKMCRFGYRESIFNTAGKGKYVITAVTFSLKPNGDPTLKYENILDYFRQKRKRKPTLPEVRKAVLEIRREKGLLGGLYRNAGSFFKNAVVDEKRFTAIRNIVLCERDKIRGGACKDPWNWRVKNGVYKISSACLMHCSGFPPGSRDGNVGTSPKQTLAITNFGGASSSDIVNFARKIQYAVKKKFGILLKPEIQFVGFDKNPLLW